MIDEWIERTGDEYHVPGVAIAIVRGGKLLRARGYGWADRERRVPMTADTLLNIGSVSKTITATAVMQLWETGALRLDDDVNDYLPFAVRNPRYPDVPITARQLLAHRSSIRDGPAYDESYACGDPTLPLDEWLRCCLVPGGVYYAAQDNFHRWRPGEPGPLPAEPRAYSNVGFGLLGYLVEVISGVPFAQYCREALFRPLAMDETAWYLAELDLAQHAVPYTYVAAPSEAGHSTPYERRLLRVPADDRPLRPGAHYPHCLYSFPNYPDGLLRTSVRQLARFLGAVISGGAVGDVRILREDTLTMMLSDEHFGRGLCWNRRMLHTGEHTWFHGGSDPGIAAFLTFRPVDGAGVIVLGNCQTLAQTMGALVERLFVEAAAA
jgi:CubicO group peptidase (beta-lactamase class C family)